MDIRTKFSVCWEGCRTCFKKSNSSGIKIDTPQKEPVVVIENPSAVRRIKPYLKTQEENNIENRFIALYDYSARTNEDLSFNAGDILEALDKKTKDWWYAKAVTGISTSKKGYIPANYVAPVESLDAEP